MRQSIFYFDRLNAWDKISIILYILTTSICGYLFYFDNSFNSNRQLLLLYTLGTHSLLYLINYKSLINLTVYFIWICFALIHLYLYFQLRLDPSLSNFRGHAATGLRNTIILLLLYQVLRIISVNIQSQELVAPSRGNTKDIFEERRITFVDFILFIIYFAIMIILSI